MKSLFLTTLLALPAAAHPVAFDGAWQLMLGRTGDVSNFELYHSYTASEAFGLHAMWFQDGQDDEAFLVAQHNWLLKRWNLPAAQANVYGGLGAGIADRDGGATGPAALGFFRADYETRRVYTSFDSKVVGSEDVNRGVFAYSAGFAPYLAEFDELNTWMIVQFEHVTGMDRDLEIIPKLRFFKDNYFFEIGCSLEGRWLANFMIHF